MKPYRALTQRLGRTRWFAWVGVNVLTRIDKRWGRRFPTPSTFGTGLPVLFLTTTGRHSGEPRMSPLVYLEDGSDYVLAATNFGQRHHPGWSYNLEAQPLATIEWRGGGIAPVTARRAEPAEIVEYWPRFVELWPGYDAYRQRAHRDIRVYVLTPQSRTQEER